jgi:two-component system invasion response regulator UvrY
MAFDSNIRILIVDDRIFIREALELFVQTQPNLTLVGQAANGEDALTLCKSLNPDVVLIDIVMPGIGGLAAIRYIREFFPTIRVVALTSHETETTREEILEAGAHEFLIKDSTADTLADAIQAVCRQ